MRTPVDELSLLVEQVLARDESDRGALETLLGRTESALESVEAETRSLHREMDEALESRVADVPRLTRELRARYAEAGRLRPVVRELRLHCSRVGVGQLR